MLETRKDEIKKGRMCLQLIHRVQPSFGDFTDFKDFKAQQDMVHKVGLKISVMLTFHVFFNKDIIRTLKGYRDEFGDELGISFHNLGDFAGERYLKIFNNEERELWLYSKEEKKKIIDFFFARFRECFGYYPTSVAGYVLDTFSLNYIKNRYPMVQTAVCACFEEGVRVFHGCNMGWYLFTEGGPWWPWYPSKNNMLRPAADKKDALDLVALPHLIRDLALCMNGRDDFYGSHPHGVLRGLAYKGDKYPYLYNVHDQNMIQHKYNDGYSYCNIFAGPNWMAKKTWLEVPRTIAVKSYMDILVFLKKRKKQGLVEDMYLTEFARCFKKNIHYRRPVAGLWTDTLFGSEKQLFWYIDPYFRTAIDMDQGGAIVDLRPYVGKVPVQMGSDTRELHDGSYPYLIQTSYRWAVCGESSIYSARLSCGGETVDLKDYRTKAEFTRGKKEHVLNVEPIEVDFRAAKVVLESRFMFRNDGTITVERRIARIAGKVKKVQVQEYLNGCWGTIEYPADQRGIKLAIANKKETVRIGYRYRSRSAEMENPVTLTATVPQVKTEVSLIPLNGANSGFIKEGFVFKPFFTLGTNKELREGGIVRTCLKLEKMK